MGRLVKGSVTRVITMFRKIPQHLLLILLDPVHFQTKTLKPGPEL